MTTALTLTPQESEKHETGPGEAGPAPAVSEVVEPAPAAGAGASFPLPRVEGMALLLTTLLLVGLHVGNLFSAGGFWRDEVGDLAYANMPSWSFIGSQLKYDNFPPLLLAVLRGWHALGLAGDGTGYRVLGLLAGLGILAALWGNARLLGARAPFFSLALFATGRLVVRVGDSVRPYGLGWLLMLVTFGLLWRVVQSARSGRVIAAGLVAVLAVQALYQNAFLLFAMGVAGMVVAARAGRWRSVVAVAGIGLAAAVSLLPYALGPVRDAGAWSVVSQGGLPWERLTYMFNAALRSSGDLMPWAWLLAAGVLGAVALFARSLPGGDDLPTERTTSHEARWYAAGATLLALPVFLGFLKFLGMATMPWYYVLPLALAASTLDVLGGALETGRRWRVARLAFLALTLALALPTAWNEVQVRATNADLAAAAVAKEAAPGDYIVVAPWPYGVPFSYYYKGHAPWTTLPPLADNSIHRYDLMKAAIEKPDAAVRPVFERVEATLRAGGRVWIVGALGATEPGKPPVVPAPAPDPRFGWDEASYMIAWERLLGDFLQAHAIGAQEINPSAGYSVSGLENMEVYRLEGWRP